METGLLANRGQFGFRFGAERQRPWKRKCTGLSGQELIPFIDRDDVDKLLNLMDAAISMGRDAIFRKWGELGYPVGTVDVWVLPH